MLKIVGNDVMRSGEKIGYLRGNDVCDASGRKLGHFSENDVYDARGRKLAYVERNSIRNAQGGEIAEVSDNRADVTGGTLSDLARAAVRVLLGD